MKFCTCGKLLAQDEIGYICICGLRFDKDGNEIKPEQVKTMQDEASYIEKRKNYRYKYPNMNDLVVRVAPAIQQSETFDETESDVPPSKLKKTKEKNK